MLKNLPTDLLEKYGDDLEAFKNVQREELEQFRAPAPEKQLSEQEIIEMESIAEDRVKTFMQRFKSMKPQSYGIVESDNILGKLKNMARRLKLRENPISNFFEDDQYIIKFHDDVQKAAIFNINAWPSSVAVESDFSKVKKLVAPDRCSLKPARVNDYMTGSSGLNLLRKISFLRRKRKREKREGKRMIKKPRL